MHAILTFEGERMTAHVDSISLAAGARLTVPGMVRGAQAPAGD
jgi:hypothetical protein